MQLIGTEASRVVHDAANKQRVTLVASDLRVLGKPWHDGLTYSSPQCPRTTEDSGIVEQSQVSSVAATLSLYRIDKLEI